MNSDKENNIILSSIPKEYTKIEIGSGTSGICYLTNDGKVFKKINYELTSLSVIKYLCNVKNSSFVFPTHLIYLNKKSKLEFIGYLMEYIKGISFTDIDKNTNIDLIVNAIKEVENNIILFSKENNILINDLHDGNVLFTKDNKLKIIDIDLYEYSYFEDIYPIIKYNLREWNEFILYTLNCRLSCFKSDILNLHHEISVTNGKYKSSDIIEEIIQGIQKEKCEDVKTLDDYYNGLKLVKKR